MIKTNFWKCPSQHVSNLQKFSEEVVLKLAGISANSSSIKTYSMHFELLVQIVPKLYTNGVKLLCKVGY